MLTYFEILKQNMIQLKFTLRGTFSIMPPCRLYQQNQFVEIEATLLFGKG